jgi:hypothetical protein
MRECDLRESLKLAMFVYVSNDNATQVEVYFDDVSVTHTPTNIIQYNEYYPFGLQANTSWTRENTTDNQFLYLQEQS